MYIKLLESSLRFEKLSLISSVEVTLDEKSFHTFTNNPLLDTVKLSHYYRGYSILLIISFTNTKGLHFNIKFNYKNGKS